MSQSFKPNMTFSQIINMNVGFLGIQYSFGLQQTAINPIYSFLGANPDQLPLLNLAGPMTGLLIQPIIGAISDKTWSPRWGRRKPFFLIGAMFCSICLFLFPFSSQLWMAVGLLWILDAANNTAMEPYRAFVADKLNDKQQSIGFMTQSFFTGLGITLANFSLYFFQNLFPTKLTETASNTIPIWVYGSFMIGAVVSITSVLFSVLKTPEIPPTDEELQKMKQEKMNLFSPFIEVFSAIRTMPKVLLKLALVYLFQWYAMFCYWQFITLSLAKSLYQCDQSNKPYYEMAVGWTGIVNGFYNIVTVVSAYFLARLAMKYAPKTIHAVSLLLAGVGLMAMPMIHQQYLTLLPMVGLGIAWASIMGIPYLIVVSDIPKEKYGVYMGIINMMIVIPMLIQTVSFKYVYNSFLGSNPNMAIVFAGILLLIAAMLTMNIGNKKAI